MDRHPETGWWRAAAAWMAAVFLAGLAGCLKDSPVVKPGRVYDGESAIRRAHLAGLDSAVLYLVDSRDSGRRVELWRGRPEDTSRIPPYHAEEGSAWYFLVQGYRQGSGLCFLESIGQDGVRVLLDTCAAPVAPRLRLRDSLIRIFEYPYQPALNLISAHPIADSTAFACSSTVPWMKPSRSAFRWKDLPADGSLPLAIDWETMPAGPQVANLRILAGDSLEAEATLIIGGALARGRILGGDTIRAGQFDATWTGTVILPDLQAPPGKKPWMLMAYLAGPDNFGLTLEGDYAGPPGARRKLTVRLPSVPRSKSWYDRPWPILAVDSDLRPVDSLFFLFDNGPRFSVSGRLYSADKERLQRSVITLDGGPATTHPDTSGSFRFLGLSPGPHRFTVDAPDRIAETRHFSMDDTGWADLQIPRVSPPLSFRRLDLGEAGLRLGPAAFIGYNLVAVTDGRPKMNRLFSHDLVTLLGGSNAMDLTFAGQDPALASASIWDLAGNGKVIFLALPDAGGIGLVQEWGKSYDIRRLPFAPVALAYRDPYLAAVGPDGEGRLRLAAFWGDHAEPAGEFLLGASWERPPRRDPDLLPRIRFLDSSTASHSGHAIPPCQILLPGPGGRLIRFRPDSLGGQVAVTPLEGEPSDFQDGLMAFRSPTVKSLRFFPPGGESRDSIPVPGGVIALGPSAPSMGWLNSMAASLDAGGRLHFTERSTGRPAGVFPFPGEARGVRLLSPALGNTLVAVTDTAVWQMKFE